MLPEKYVHVGICILPPIHASEASRVVAQWRCSSSTCFTLYWSGILFALETCIYNLAVASVSIWMAYVFNVLLPQRLCNKMQKDTRIVNDHGRLKEKQ